tara:strand:- start:559 stop:741 length:183 start_codon:yes stop_codon:yes gene_type:complete
MDIEEKMGNLIAQQKQVKLEIYEFEEALIERKKLLNKIDGAIEFAKSITEEPKKKGKKDA